MSGIQLTSVNGSSGGYGSGLDIQAIVKAIVDSYSGKVKKLEAKQTANEDTINLSNKVMDKMQAVSKQFDSVKSAAASPNATADNVASAMKDFVTGFNELVAMAKPATKNAVVDRSITDSISQFKNSIMGSVDGTPGFTTLAQAGLATQRDGSLSFDATKLRDMFTSDPTSTKNLIGSVDSNVSISSLTLSSYSSALGNKVSMLTSYNNNIANQIDRENYRLTNLTTKLTAQYAKVDAAIGSLNSIGMNLNKLG